MASSINRPARLLASTVRTQCPRAAWLSSRTAIRAANITTSTSPTTAYTPAPSTQTSPQFSTSPHLPTEAPKTPKLITARVSNAGHMDKTVRATIATRVWDNYLRKFYKSSRHLLVHDPANSLRDGDMISVRHLTAQKTAQVRHVVHEILVPFGEDIDARPAVPSAAEVDGEHAARTAEKVSRRGLRARAASGDEEAVREVSEQGIAVREVVKGRGRSRRVMRVLERDMGKKK